MRLLLTSGGITNPSIRNALVDLLGKPIAEASALYVPTAIYANSRGASLAAQVIRGEIGAPLYIEVKDSRRYPHRGRQVTVSVAPLYIGIQDSRRYPGSGRQVTAFVAPFRLDRRKKTAAPAGP